MGASTGKWRAEELGLDVPTLLAQALSHPDIEAAFAALARDGRTVEPQKLIEVADSAHGELEQDAAAELDMLAASLARLRAMEDRLIGELAPGAEGESAAGVAELSEQMDDARIALGRLQAAEARVLAWDDELGRLLRQRQLAETRELVDRASAQIEESMRLIEGGEDPPRSPPPRRRRSKIREPRPETSIVEKRQQLAIERRKLQADQMPLLSTLERLSAQRERAEARHRETLLALVADSPALSAARSEVNAMRTRAAHGMVEKGIVPFLRSVLSAELDQAYERRYSQQLVLEGGDDLGGHETPSRLVPTNAYRETERLLTQLTGGSIGIAGARGAGKSTLIAEFCSGERTIGGARPTLNTVVSAPVRYEPGEFVLHLFAKLCRQARSAVAGDPGLESEEAARQLFRLRTIVNLAAGAMLVVGIAAIGASSDVATPIVAGVALLVVAGFLLTDGTPVAPLLNPAGLLLAWPGLVVLGFAGLVVAGLELATGGASLASQAPTLVAGASTAACGGFAVAMEPLEVGGPEVDSRRPRGPGHPRMFSARASLVLAAAAATLVTTGIVDARATPPTLVGTSALLLFSVVSWATVTRPSSPFLRFFAHGLGWAVVSAALLVVVGTTRVEPGAWSSVGALLVALGVVCPLAAAATLYVFGSQWPEEEGRSSAPDYGLARLADEYLLKIEYLERKAAGWTTTVKAGVGSAAALAAEASRSGTTELSRLALSRPDAVDLFRRFVARATRKGPVIIGIDELDKLSAPGRAEDFLNEIKAVFGEERCYFLVSISDDAVASFERRGMPFRDVWESTLDEVVHLDPFDLALSRELLARQLIGVSVPFAALCHVMSGGLARENLRALRALRDLSKTTGLGDLGSLSRHLLANDLLKKRDATSTMLGALSPSTELRGWSSLLASLAEADIDQLGTHMRSMRLTGLGSVAGSHEDDARFQQIVTHFLAYWYLCDTTVAFFSRQFDAGRMEEAEQRGPRGIEHLATARRELAISAHLAWQSVSTFRGAWNREALSLSTVSL